MQIQEYLKQLRAGEITVEFLDDREILKAMIYELASELDQYIQYLDKANRRDKAAFVDIKRQFVTIGDDLLTVAVINHPELLQQMLSPIRNVRVIYDSLSRFSGLRKECDFLAPWAVSVEALVELLDIKISCTQTDLPASFLNGSIQKLDGSANDLEQFLKKLTSDKLGGSIRVIRIDSLDPLNQFLKRKDQP